MARNKLLQEAIADARTVRETAIASAKQALEEAFTPQLKSMLSQKIQEEEWMDDEEDLGGEEEISLEAHDLEDEVEDVEDAVDDVRDSLDDLDLDDDDDVEIEADFDLDAGDEEEDNLDLESIIRELEGDLEGDLEDEMDEVSSEEFDDVSDELEDVSDELDDIDFDEEFEIDLNELMREMEDMDLGDDLEDEFEMDDELQAENARLRSDLAEHKRTVRQLKSQLQEINLLNSKLLYTTKLFRNYNLTNEQKVRVLESFDRAGNVRDVKLVYTTLGESLRFGGVRKKKKINESVASRTTGTTRPQNKAILQEGHIRSRMQELANIKSSR